MIQKLHLGNGNSNHGCLLTQHHPLTITERYFPESTPQTGKKEIRLNYENSVVGTASIQENLIQTFVLEM
jgi:hypothetical protein